MSSASTTRTIKFLSKAGTYTALIMSPTGDLYQEWEGAQDEVTNIYPNFEVVKPLLYFVCTSSRVAEGVATPDAINFYFNDRAATTFITVCKSLKTSLNCQDLPRLLSKW